MNQAILLFSTSDSILLALVILMILGRLLSYILSQFEGAKSFKLNVFGRHQPWLPALLILLSFILGIVINKFSFFPPDSKTQAMVEAGLIILRALLIIWLFIKEAEAIHAWLCGLTPQGSLLRMVLPQIKKSLMYLAVILTLPFILSDFNAYPDVAFITSKVTTILVILALTCMSIQLLSALEQALVKRLSERDVLQSFSSRRIYTQARVFRKIAVVVIIILAVSITAMMFENIRELGTSILASAGIVSVILGFAAQKTLGNLFSGIQIAITQPIRINDTIIIQNEFGVVEEISLTYVVLKIWDLRRLIIPINQFIEQPFQNLTRNSTDLLCPVFFYADYNVPVSALREKYMEILKVSEFWDGNVATLQVTAAQENVLQIRALASVKNSGDSWNLKCEILEKMVEFIAQTYPDSLPKHRNIFERK